MHVLNRKMRHSKSLGIIIVCMTLLSACIIGDDTSDLKEFVAKEKAKPAKKIPSLPTFETYISVPYAAGHLRDPFMPFMPADQGIATVQPGNIKPPTNHKTEPLEKFPLDALKFAGVLERQGERWGIIVAPDKLVHHVRVGDYMGENLGKITSITETKIELTETVSNGMGGWVERPAAISVVE